MYPGEAEKAHSAATPFLPLIITIIVKIEYFNINVKIENK
jgi:hypothetical protein